MVRDISRDHLITLVLACGAATTSLNINTLSPLIKAIGHDFGASDATVGQLAAVHATIAGITALLVAPWVDRFPRRIVLRMEYGLVGAATLLSMLAPSLGWLFLARAVAGLGGAIIAATCYAAAGDIFEDHEQRNRAIGAISVAFSLSMIAGLPIITLVGHEVGWRASFACLLLPLAVAAAGTHLLPAGRAAEGPGEIAGRPETYRTVLGSWRVNWLLAAVVVFCMVFAGWMVYFGPFTATVFSVGAGTLSLLYLVAGSAQLAAGSIVPAMLKRVSAPVNFAIWTAIMSVALTVVSVAGTRWLLFPFIAISSLGCVVLYLTITVLLLDTMPSAHGAVMALQTGCYEIGWAAGTSLTGVALATVTGYAGVYRLLALLLPASLLCVLMSVHAVRRLGLPVPSSHLKGHLVLALHRHR